MSFKLFLIESWLHDTRPDTFPEFTLYLPEILSLSIEAGKSLLGHLTETKNKTNHLVPQIRNVHKHGDGEQIKNEKRNRNKIE